MKNFERITRRAERKMERKMARKMARNNSVPKRPKFRFNLLGCSDDILKFFPKNECSETFSHYKYFLNTNTGEIEMRLNSEPKKGIYEPNL